MLKNDKWIKKMAAQRMITPFEPELVREVEIPATVETTYSRSYPECPDFDVAERKVLGTVTRKVISYGTSSYGYDLRLSPREFKVFRHIPGTVGNPKDFNPGNLEPVELDEDRYGEFFILPAHSYGLGVAVERLEIPENITCLFIGKSTYARCGLIWNLTPGEAGWRGHLTLEVSNSSHADWRIYANEGVVQALFLEGDPCEVSYETRQGKYQDQPEQIVMARI